MTEPTETIEQPDIQVELGPVPAGPEAIFTGPLPEVPARKPRKRRTTTADTPVVPFQLLEEPCPAGCVGGNVLGFDQSLGQILHIECQECLGVGVIEVQVDTGE